MDVLTLFDPELDVDDDDWDVEGLTSRGLLSCGSGCLVSDFRDDEESLLSSDIGRTYRFWVFPAGPDLSSSTFLV